MFLSILLLYLCFVNVISVIVTVADKINAVKHKERVSESLLLFLAAIGGSLFMYITMKCIRHKTRKKKFMISIPLFLVVQVLILTLLYIYF